MSNIELAFAAVIAAGWVYLVGAAAIARGFARRNGEAAAGRPPVSIMKPLFGVEPSLYDNLRSFAEQDYPQFQLVLGIREPRDPALAVARALKRDLPERDIAIVVDPRAGGSNLKVCNLENMLPVAKLGILVLSDSDIRVGRDYLAAVTAPHGDPRTGLVTSLYKGASTGGLWSDLGALHVDFGFLPGALVGEALGIGNGCFGASIAIRREVLERTGGFARIRDELADDWRLGEAVREAGLSVAVSRYVVETRVAEPSFRSLWRHEVRWARTSRTLAPIGFAGSLVTHPVAIAVLAAAANRFALTWCAILVISCLVRLVTARAGALALGLSRQHLWLLPMRDILSFAVFVASFFGRSVFWRDQHFRVAADGHMTADGEKAL